MNDSRPSPPHQPPGVTLLDTDAEPGPVAHELPTCLALLGSDRDCDLILAAPGRCEGQGPELERVHAAIVRLAGAAYICDLGATGGTILNGRRIKWARIANGDDIFVGPRGFEVRLTCPNAPARTEHPVFSLRGKGAAAAVTSIDPVLIVGSAPGCDVVIEDGSVAPRHCVVVWTDAGPLVRRVQTERPTLLNGRPIRSASIAAGDVIAVGSHELRFETEAPIETAATAAPSESTPRSVSASVRKLVSGRLAGDWSRSPGGLWIGRNKNAASRRNRLGTSPVTPVASPAVAPPAAAGSDAKDPKAPHDTEERGNLEIPADEAFFNVQSRQQLDERVAELRQRVTAAQSALDARARKHWDGLERERENLRLREAELNRRVLALEDVPAPSRGDSDGPHDHTDFRAPTDSAFSDLQSSTDSPRPPKTAGCTAVDPSPTRGNSNLEARVAELVAMARAEADELRRSEASIEALRLENERFKSSITRQRERLESRRTTLSERFRSLEQSRESIRAEREPLLTRIRRLEADEAAIATSLGEAARLRSELDRELEVLAQAQHRFKTQQQKLFDRLEIERKRIQGRQAEIQLKTADLERVLLLRLNDIEVELSARKSELQQATADLAGSLPSAPSPETLPAEQTLDSLAGDTAEQLAALRRIEDASIGGAARLDAIRQRVEALSQTESLFEDRKGWQARGASASLRGLKEAAATALVAMQQPRTEGCGDPSDRPD